MNYYPDFINIVRSMDILLTAGWIILTKIKTVSKYQNEG